MVAGAGQGAHIPVVVGDDDQSIYGWRGAKIENIQRYSATSPPRTIRLEQNYRSTADILQAANGVIAHNFGRLGKELWTAGGAASRSACTQVITSTMRPAILWKAGEKWLQARAPPRVAILYRSNAQSRVLEEALIRSAIPYRIYGGQRFYERTGNSQCPGLSAPAAQARGDDAAVERVINTPPRGIGDKTLDTVREGAPPQRKYHCGEQMLLCWEKNSCRPGLQCAGGFCRVDRSGLRREVPMELPLQLMIMADTRIPGCCNTTKRKRARKARRGLKTWRNWSARAKFVPEEEGELHREQQFLDRAALDAGDAQADEHEDSVQLMTLHSAKGLEFPLVFLAGMEENLFPHRMSVEEPGRLEEERRLCYVGITRAMEKLVHYLCRVSAPARQ